MMLLMILPIVSSNVMGGMRRVLCSPALLASVAVQKGAGKWPLFNDAWAREHRWD